MTAPKHTPMSCGCVDVHTHVVPHTFPKYMGRHAGALWPSMMDAQPCHRHVMIDGKVFRTIAHQAWDLRERQQDMARTNVARQVLSPMPELLSYWLEPEDGAAMCRFINETIAEMVHAAPLHFSGLAAVPLQDPDAAIRELHHAIHDLKLAGVEIGTNINGTPIGHARFKPFFQACAQLGAAVFVHPLRPAGMDRLVGPPVYEQAVAFPGEVGLAAISMLTGGTLLENPNLRIAFSHGGGSLLVQIPRLQKAWETLPTVQEHLGEAPRDSVRRMYYDNLFYDATAIEALVHLAGSTRVMVGSDYPFAIMDPLPDQRVESLRLDEAVKQALRHDNAMRWLGLAS